MQLSNKRKEKEIMDLKKKLILNYITLCKIIYKMKCCLLFVVHVYYLCFII